MGSERTGKPGSKGAKDKNRESAKTVNRGNPMEQSVEVRGNEDARER